MTISPALDQSAWSHVPYREESSGEDTLRHMRGNDRGNSRRSRPDAAGANARWNATDESLPTCGIPRGDQPEPNLIGRTPIERAQVRRWLRWFDQDVVVPMTMGFRGGAGRPMFEPRMSVASPAAAAELTSLANEKFVWLDGQLAGRDHLELDRFTWGPMVFCFTSRLTGVECLKAPQRARMVDRRTAPSLRCGATASREYR